MSIKIILDKCTGCTLCVKACPFAAIKIENRKAVIDLDTCTLCGACVPTCKFNAIDLKKDLGGGDIDLSHYKDVWVFAEQREGKVQSVAYELLSEGRQLAADCGSKLCAVLLGDADIESQVKSLFEYGAEKVYLVTHNELKQYRTAPYTRALAEVVTKHKPEIILLGATTLGRDLAARLAVRVGAGLTADCTGLAIDPVKKHLLQTRPAFGGNIMATIQTIRHRPQMATVRPRVMLMPASDSSRKGEIVRESISAKEDTATPHLPNSPRASGSSES